MAQRVGVVLNCAVTMSMTGQRRILLLQARNLGDAVISTALVETVAQSPSVSSVDVLTRPEISKIFTDNPHVNEVFTARFPMGSLHDFGWKEALALPGLVRLLRRKKYTDVVNLEGDFREDLLASWITRNDNWSPHWAADHPCSKVVRPSVIPLANRPVPIPSSKPNVHDAVAVVGMAVAGTAAQKPALYTPARQKIVWNPQGRSVGIHPMASQPWRRWGFEQWNVVAKSLLERDMEVHVFGSPSEAGELKKHFGQLETSRLSIITGSLTDYFAAVSRMRVLLCPDSFASHVAYALGVPTILLNGANDAKAWAPPGSMVLAAGPELKCYPCYNRPTCFGSPDEYACVRRIDAHSVLQTVWEVLQGSSDDDLPVSSPAWSFGN